MLRTADHGELGLSHGLREKAYSAYEEMIHVPLCISNPNMFPTPRQTNAFWSHADLMATACELAGIKIARTAGVSQVPVLQNPAIQIRDLVLFAFDDSFLNISPTQYNTRIRALRTGRYTYAAYFSNNGTPFEYELYDNYVDPLQMNNLLFQPQNTILPLWVELDAALRAAMLAAGAAPADVMWPARWPVSVGLRPRSPVPPGRNLARSPGGNEKAASRAASTACSAAKTT